MSSVNKVCLLGSLGQDPDVRTTQDGSKVVNMSIATSERWKDRNTGEKRERTEWHRVVIFNEGLAGIAEQYLRKGSKVYVEGKLQTRKWTDQSGQERYTTEVVLQRFNGELVFLGGREDGGSSQGGYGGSTSGGATTSTPSGRSSAPEDLDDEIPF